MASKYDIVVVGGGPAGLATALAIHKVNPRWRCGVFERARELREIGASVALLPNGQKALGAISAEALQTVKARGSVTSGSITHNLSGELVLNEASRVEKYQEWQEKYGHPPVQISWYDLQQALLEQLPDNTLQLGHTFTSYTEDDEGVNISFGEVPDVVRATVLIGCDGANSAVRRACLGPGACYPEPTGNMLYRGVLPVPQAFQEHYDKQNITTYVASTEGTRMMMLVPLTNNRVALHAAADGARMQPTASVSQPAPATAEGGTAAPVDACPADHRATSISNNFSDNSSSSHNGSSSSPWAPAAVEARIQRFREVFAGGPPWIFEAVTEAKVLSENEELRRPATGSAWGRGPITLVGDAAHLIPPMHAQGTSQAFEDALELGHRLAVQGLNPEALRQYEAARTPRVQALQEYEKQNARALMEGEMLDQIFGKLFEPLVVVG